MLTILYLSSATSAAALSLPLKLICDGDSSSELLLELADLAAMETIEVSTSTPWTEVASYKAVEVRTLISLCECTVSGVQASALNNYTASIPSDHIYEDGAMVAFLKNETPMPITERGPYWIIFDFDALGDKVHPAHHNVSVWQMDRLAAHCSQ